MRITRVLLVAISLAASGGALIAKSQLPPRFIVNSEEDARKFAWPQPVPVLGTGSMAPYIPASPDRSEVVAIAAVECPPYEELQAGDLVVFRWNEKKVVHQIVARQGESWISNGINNPRYDGPRVNRDTFLSRVVRVYIIADAVRKNTADSP